MAQFRRGGEIEMLETLSLVTLIISVIGLLLLVFIAFTSLCIWLHWKKNMLTKEKKAKIQSKIDALNKMAQNANSEIKFLYNQQIDELKEQLSKKSF